jgi:hypothetical protein
MRKSLLASIKKWLRRPLPFYENYKQKIAVPILLTVLVMIGIIIINPLDNIDILLKQTLDVFKYGLIIIVISLIFNLILPEVFPKIYNVEKWNIQKTIVLFSATVLTIAINITVFAYFFDNPENKHFISFFFAIILRSIVLGFFPIVLLVFYSERILYRKNHLRAIEIIDELKANQQIEQNRTKNAIYTFAKNTKDEIKITENELLYIKAEGNYCLLVYEKESNILKHLIRSSLKEVEYLICKSEQFFRCHKSYIINLNKILDVKGNAKGYIFCLKDECKIPSSRNISKSLINKIKTNRN